MRTPWIRGYALAARPWKGGRAPCRLARLPRKQTTAAAAVLLASPPGAVERSPSVRSRRPRSCSSRSTRSAPTTCRPTATRGAATPALDAFARRGSRCSSEREPCRSPCPPTRRSSPASAARPRGARQRRLPLAAQKPTLPSASARGPADGRAVSAFVLRAAPGSRRLRALRRCAQRRCRGRARSARSSATARSARVAARAGSRPAAGTPFFVFLHLYEPHTPTPRPSATGSSRIPTTARSRTRTSCVGRLLDGLRRAGVYDRAIVVVTSDHGGGPRGPR